MSESDGCIKCSFVLNKVIREGVGGGEEEKGGGKGGLCRVGVTKESNFLNWEPLPTFEPQASVLEFLK